jgi:DNA-directed RNA polymerase specialized sigma24 family protein
VDRAIEHDILGDLIKNETNQALYAALDELPDRYRDAVVLCDLEERNYDDAARLMGCPIGTVRSRLHRARALLAARLDPAAGESNGRKRARTYGGGEQNRKRGIKAEAMLTPARRITAEMS